ncbi:acetolactate synthase-1/2/3 large subunit [Rhizobium tibeticum]|uniref:acetolactate synthase 3 large subunit n=1 Tax=Rhizobium tibeticum TaxID=501024 RepID=UPI00278B348A|nr:acetolactate synthase 3 large subunit [Rhizobium tibeticum]MDP9811524.1 acetolactate synthase-1/2/3 large subunit [Rhizobium tibeticum]
MTSNLSTSTTLSAHHEEMTGAEMVVRALVDQGVEVLFGYPGGAVLPIYDALISEPRLRHILVRHEQGAAHAAEGYARSSGKPGVVLVTSGPGAINTVVGIVDALMDSIPLIVITGQVPTHLIGTDAFQEADTIGITRSCTKHSYLVRNIEDLPRVMHEAYRIATTGRPGPVVIDIPKDVQVARGRYIGPRDSKPLHVYEPQTKGNPASVAEAVRLLSEARRPILYTGGGIINSGPGASRRLREFAALVGAPVTSTLMGLGAFPASDPSWLGMPGMHGAYEANHAMHDCDVMLCIGARFDDRVTGRLDAFSPGSRKIHVDIDPSSIGKTVPVDVGIVGDASSVLEDLIAAWPREGQEKRNEKLAPWWLQIDNWRARRAFSYRSSSTVIKPQYALERLRALTRERDVYVTTEVGQHQMWAAQFFHLNEPNRWMTSGGLGTMGYGLPAAIGVQLAHPDSLVIDIAGEASILMNMQEMSTAAQYKLPVKIFILNNEYMGMIRQWQELLHDERYSHSYSESLPDFVKLAEAYGAVGIRAETPDELDGKIIEMLDSPRAVIFDCRVEKTENCLPMIPSGKPHNEMILSDEVVDMGSVITAEGRALV